MSDTLDQDNAGTGLFGPLVEADWLAANLTDPGVKVLDATWHLPTSDQDGFDDYLKAHIPGAVYFDIDAVADQTSRLPHMLPSPEVFGAAAGAMGLSNDDRIVVYDPAGAFSAPRVWWMFRVFGHHRVAVLNGGLRAWRDGGSAVDSGDHHPVASTARSLATANWWQMAQSTAAFCMPSGRVVPSVR